MILRSFKQSNGDFYELRSAGSSLRLYRNKIFHSQVNASRLANGGVWDLLWLPSLLVPAAHCQRILVLGVGLGAAIFKLRQFFPNAKITAVDIDPINLVLAQHLQSAKTTADLVSKKFWQSLDVDSGERRSMTAVKRTRRLDRSHGVEWITADALKWMGKPRARQYQLIIDDLFIDQYAGVDGETGRVIPLDGLLRQPALLKSGQERQWVHYLVSALSDHGMLVANCANAGDARRGVKSWRQHSARVSNSRETICPRNAWILRTEGYENRVLAAIKGAEASKGGILAMLDGALRQRLDQSADNSYRSGIKAAIRPINGVRVS